MALRHATPALQELRNRLEGLRGRIESSRLASRSLERHPEVTAIPGVQVSQQECQAWEEAAMSAIAEQQEELASWQQEEAALARKLWAGVVAHSTSLIGFVESQQQETLEP